MPAIGPITRPIMDSGPFLAPPPVCGRLEADFLNAQGHNLRWPTLEKNSPGTSTCTSCTSSLLFTQHPLLSIRPPLLQQPPQPRALGSLSTYRYPTSDDLGCFEFAPTSQESSREWRTGAVRKPPRETLFSGRPGPGRRVGRHLQTSPRSIETDSAVFQLPK